MKIIGIITARMKSKRLPGKVMLEVLGKPVLGHIYNRLKFSKLLNNIVIASGEFQKNVEIHEYVLKHGIPNYFGKESDVIDRLYNTAKKFDATVIVRITADCPFVDPNIVDNMVSEYLKNKQYDVITNARIRTFPHGLEVEVSSMGAIEKMWKKIKSPELREWFTIYRDSHPNLFRILDVTNPTNLSNLRWTLDYPKDFEFVKKIYQNLYKENNIFDMNDILELLKQQPDLTKINSKYIGHYNIDAPKSS